jgi:hypothetical protein
VLFLVLAYLQRAAFLDRFAYRNPKQRDGSDMTGAARDRVKRFGKAAITTPAEKAAAAADDKQQPAGKDVVNSDSFLRLSESQVRDES